MKIGIIVGSIRTGRAGASVGQWVAQQAAGRAAAYEIVDLAAFDVPLLTESTLPMAAQRSYDSEAVRRWSAAIDSYDGYVFVTAEYNHGVPGAFKNAVDSLGPEWVGKAVAFVSYGADAGVRAVEHWRQIVANFSMVDVRAQVSLRRFEEFDAAASVQPNARRAGELTALFEQLESAIARQG